MREILIAAATALMTFAGIGGPASTDIDDLALRADAAGMTAYIAVSAPAPVPVTPAESADCQCEDCKCDPCICKVANTPVTPPAKPKPAPSYREETRYRQVCVGYGGRRGRVPIYRWQAYKVRVPASTSNPATSQPVRYRCSGGSCYRY